MKRKNAWTVYHKEDITAVEELGSLYRRFLDWGKTERECIAYAAEEAEKAGFHRLESFMENVSENAKGNLSESLVGNVSENAKENLPESPVENLSESPAGKRSEKRFCVERELQPGDKIYVNHMGKAAAFFIIGEAPPEQGMNVIGAHVDSPRLDIKQVPLYEERGNAYLDTHYYGGVKKYQWLALPLALHGVVVKKDGEKIPVCIGENSGEPVFVITDLLPHLGKERNEQKVKDFIDAEKLDVLIGNRPLEGETEEGVKTGVLQLLFERYRMREEDFISAELEVVPAGKARECGLDKSMILGYGQDDRSCAFAAFYALLNMSDGIPKRTVCCLLVDKEETGSRGATGMQSRFFENAVAEILYAYRGKMQGGQPQEVQSETAQQEPVRQIGEGALRQAGQRPLPLDLRLRRTLQNSAMLSADVSAAYDPMYEEYFEKKNAAYLANGVVFGKYSGSGGKSGGNDANAEFMAKLREIMEKNHVLYQTAELGAVDRGGGGTIACMTAEYGMEVIDCGIPVLCMHAPWEIISKADLYEAVKAYSAFYAEPCIR